MADSIVPDIALDIYIVAMAPISMPTAMAKLMSTPRSSLLRARLSFTIVPRGHVVTETLNSRCGTRGFESLAIVRSEEASLDPDAAEKPLAGRMITGYPTPRPRFALPQDRRFSRPKSCPPLIDNTPHVIDGDSPFKTFAEGSGDFSTFLRIHLYGNRTDTEKLRDHFMTGSFPWRRATPPMLSSQAVYPSLPLP